MAKAKRAPTIAALRKELALVEVDLSDAELGGTVANCETHIRYWRLREAIASREIRALKKDPDGSKSRESFRILRQCSDQCCMWEQRREQAKRSAQLDDLAYLEALIRDRHKNANRLARIKT